MGVDASLYLSNTHMLEAIVYSAVKAHGVDIDPVDGEPNIFSSTHYVERPEHSLGFSVLYGERGAKGDFICYMHQTNDGPLGPCVYLSGRSNARVIALFRTVAERFGGVLRYSDYDDSAKVFHGMYDEDTPGTDFERTCKLAYETPKAEVTAEDIENASYPWDCEDCGEPMYYDRNCRNDCNKSE